MKMWVQVQGHDEDDEYPETATYQILAGGVLRVTSGNDIHLYSPAQWQELLIDARSAAEREEHLPEPDNDLKWQ